MNSAQSFTGGESRRFDPELLEILRCPETHQKLEQVPAAVLEKLNTQIVAGCIKNNAGQTVSEKLTGGLARADGKLLYPIFATIPILLVDEAIQMGDLK